jgi:sortase A
MRPLIDGAASVSLPPEVPVSGRRVASNVLFLAGMATLVVPLLHRVTNARASYAGDAALAEAVAALPRPADAVPSPPVLLTEPAKPPARRPRRAAVESGEAWGRIEIPRVGLDWVVVEGVEDADLRKGPGHVPDSAGPDAPKGNCVIAGHRNSFFRRLNGVRRGDVVLVQGLDGSTASYRLDSSRIVAPEEVSVMEPTPDRRLTLITCYPFGYVGDAPYRLIWSAVAAGETASPASATTDSAPSETLEPRATIR